MEWIAETLRVFGFINRGHLQRKFGVSAPQAANDFRLFMKRHPNVMTYDTSAKRYTAKATAKPCQSCGNPRPGADHNCPARLR